MSETHQHDESIFLNTAVRIEEYRQRIHRLQIRKIYITSLGIAGCCVFKIFIYNKWSSWYSLNHVNMFIIISERSLIKEVYKIKSDHNHSYQLFGTSRIIPIVTSRIWKYLHIKSSFYEKLNWLRVMFHQVLFDMCTTKY